MKSAAAAKSYAKALFDLAKERGLTDQVARDMSRIVALFDESADLRAVLARPWLGAATKRATAAAVVERADLSPLVRDFVALVAARGRAEILDTIADAYRDLVDADAGRVRAKVRTAVALTTDERRVLSERLARELGAREVILDEVIDPDLLGGFVAEVGSLVVDGSLNGQLARLAERLTKV